MIDFRQNQDKSQAQVKTDLAEDRTALANERTFASWLRTGFGAIGIGLAFNALFTRLDPPWVAKAMATVFLAIAVFIFIAAERRFCAVTSRLSTHQVQAIRAGRAKALSYMATAATILLAAVLWLLPFAPRT